MSSSLSFKGKNWIQCGLAVAFVSAIGFSCSSSNNSSTPSGGVTPAAPTPTVTVGIPSGAAALAEAAYGQNPLTVTAPAAVVWVNNDTAPHSATDPGAFDTGVIQPSASSSPIPFSSPGSYPYGSTVTGDENMAGLITVVAPSPSPSPSASASPSPSASPVGWSDVTLQLTSCPFTPCPATDGFTVNSDGTYTSGSGASGHITATELNGLNLAASAEAQSANQAGYSCTNQSLVGVPEGTVNETFASGGPQQVYNHSGGQVCFLGSQATATALYTAMINLARAYDNGTAPAPSPSASPSPSPSPSSSTAVLHSQPHPHTP